MKKKLSLTIGSLALAGLVGLGIAQASTVGADPDLSETDVEQKVSSQYPGEITDMNMDNSSGEPLYHVEIETKAKEYELKVDGNTGEILRLDEKQQHQPESQANTEKSESHDAPVTANETGVNKQEKHPETKADASASSSEKDNAKTSKEQKKEAIISHDEAKRIALSEFSGNVDGVELEEDDGHLRYEVEMENGDSEAEMAIDAYTGKIVFIEIDD